MVGVISERFEADLLTVRQLGDHHFVCQRSRPLFDCGTKAEDAQRLLEAIRRHRFDHVCRIGPTDAQSLTILVRSY